MTFELFMLFAFCCAAFVIGYALGMKTECPVCNDDAMECFYCKEPLTHAEEEHYWNCAWEGEHGAYCFACGAERGYVPKLK